MHHRRKALLRTSTIGAIAIAGALTISACSSSSKKPASPSASVDATSVSAICKQGAAEGEVDYWDQGTPSVDKHIWAAFNQKYPDITVKTSYVEPVDMVQKLTTLNQAGRAIGTDALALTPDFASLLDQKGMLDHTFDWGTLSGETGLETNHSLRIGRQFIGVAYNTDHVKDSDLPTTWQGLVNSKWQHRLVVDPRGDQLQLLALSWGQAKVVSYVQNLMKTDDPAVVNGGTAGLLTIESGENLLETNGSSPNVALARSNGAPVAIHYFDLIPAADYYFAIPKGAAHPYAAACLALWENSPAGRATSKKYEYETNTDQPDNAPAGSKVITVQSPADATLVANTAAAISKIITNS